MASDHKFNENSQQHVMMAAIKNSVIWALTSHLKVNFFILKRNKLWKGHDVLLGFEVLNLRY